MSEALQELQAHIELRQSDAVLSAAIAHEQLNVDVTMSGLVSFVQFLKTDPTCKFRTLIDITAIDEPSEPYRFTLVYQFLSMYRNQRIRLKLKVREEDIVPSIVGVFPAANWFEREVFDMFGVLFSGHPDLRRILTDYGFRGYPLRKDFPTTGYTEVRYDEVQKRVVYEPVSLVQEYRQFDFMSPWEGAEYIIPGDEKAEGKA